MIYLAVFFHVLKAQERCAITDYFERFCSHDHFFVASNVNNDANNCLANCVNSNQCNFANFYPSNPFWNVPGEDSALCQMFDSSAEPCESIDNSQQARLIVCDTWMTWSEWDNSACNETCGEDLFKTRTRTCIGSCLDGEAEQSELCDLEPCEDEEEEEDETAKIIAYAVPLAILSLLIFIALSILFVKWYSKRVS